MFGLRRTGRQSECTERVVKAPVLLTPNCLDITEWCYRELSHNTALIDKFLKYAQSSGTGDDGIRRCHQRRITNFSFHTIRPHPARRLTAEISRLAASRRWRCFLSQRADLAHPEKRANSIPVFFNIQQLI